ncbi:MAG: NUDIX hydrolase [Myxococcota bacterium]
MTSTIKKWTTLATEVLQRTPIFTLHRMRRKHPDDGRESDFFLVDSPDWVNVIAVTPDEQIVLVRQYRHGTDSITLEIPGGCVDEGEEPEDAARRELLEETGYSAERFEDIGRISANPAFLNNYCTTFVAHDAVRIGAQRPDEHEELAIELYPLAELHRLVRDGEIHHGIVVCAAYHLLTKSL